ncbi:MAG TPA: hypothetical protein VMS31_18935 [Pyrinomonadaceae bacterium]|nr:hypothetical protein [Pyrinomonadaceae bacterium]
MTTEQDFPPTGNASDVTLCAFALADCVVQVDAQIAKYLRAVHRTALELAVPNLFGLEIGGYWLTSAQIIQLRKLPDFYPSNEAGLAKRAVEAYLLAQTDGLEPNTNTLVSPAKASPR